MNKKVKMIIGIILLLIIASAICSCKTTKYVTVPEYHSDTVQVSTHDTIKVTQHDQNVSVPLPIVYLSNTTKDTVSVLKDGLYKSTASLKDGILKHSLETLPGAKVYGTAQVADTSKVKYIYRNEKADCRKPVYIEKPLTSMQKFFIDTGKIMCMIIALLIVYAIFKLAIFIKKKI